jgi:hypothetical protein
VKRSEFVKGASDSSLLEDLREELLSEMEDRLESQKLRRRRNPRRDRGRLRREVYSELNAMRAIENRMQRSRVSPEARVLLDELMEEASDQGFTMDDLFRAMPRPSLTDRLSGFLQSRNGTLLLLALLALMATPSTREMLKPALKKLVGEINELTDQFRGLLSKVKEGIEDVVAEAKFEDIKDAIDKTINEDHTTPEQ